MTGRRPFALQASPETRRFLSFLLAGGFSAAVNLTSRFALSRVLPYEAAVACAYLIGMVTAFLLFRQFVFAQGGSWLGEFGRFALVNAFAFCLVWITSVGLARVIFPTVGFEWHAEDVAHLIGVMTPIVSSYYGHKNYSFRKDVGLGEGGLL